MPYVEKGRDPNWPNIPDDIIDIINRHEVPTEIKNEHFVPHPKWQLPDWVMWLCTAACVFVTFGTAYQRGMLLDATVITGAVIAGYLAMEWLIKRRL